jgi:hypothetical protein
MSAPENIAVLIGNLPPDVTEEDVEDALDGLGYDLRVALTRDDKDERLLAIVRFDGMTRGVAEKLAARINGMPWRGRTLTAYVPLFWK